jgi:hypothetical protein
MPRLPREKTMASAASRISLKLASPSASSSLANIWVEVRPTLQAGERGQERGSGPAGPAGAL